MKLALLVVVVLMVPFAFAEGYPTSVINGVVYSGETIKSSPVQGVDVVVYCEDSYQLDTTDEKGAFRVVFQDYECAIGQDVTACVQENCQTKTNIGTTSRFQLTEVKLFKIPEFGAISGIAAIAGSIGAYLALRRKH